MLAEYAPNIRILDTRPDLERAAADEIAHAARVAIGERGVFRWALAGGETPRSVYRLLASPLYSGTIEWPRVHLFFSDERMVPPDDAQSNYMMAYDTLISRVPLPPQNIHRIRGELPPLEAAALYARDLDKALAPDGVLDLLLLGIGDDGHTASLFPGTPAVNEMRDTVSAVFVPKFGAWRVTLTLPVLNGARRIVFLVSGAAKAPIVRRLVDAGPDRALPASLVQPRDGALVWLLDRDAAGV